MQSIISMKNFSLIVASSILLVSCGSGSSNNAEKLAKLKSERSALDQKIKELEAANKGKNPQKATPVSVITLSAQKFQSNIDVQSSVIGQENVLATSQAPGVVQQILVRTGQKVAKGQTLAVLDAAAIEQQIKGVEVQLNLFKSLYEKQKNLFAENIGSEIQLMQAKAQYEGAQKQKEALVAQRNMYRIISPIHGQVDVMNLKIGDMVSPGQIGIRVVNFDDLKVEANLGENYIGKVKTGDPVTVIFPDLNDSIQTKLNYVGRQIDPMSRSFLVQVRLGDHSKIYPNMSCKLKIANYQNSNALVVPVQVIQKTAEGNMLYIVENNKAKAIIVEVGKNYEGQVEILSGLNIGDQVITEGFGDISNGDAIQIAQ